MAPREEYDAQKHQQLSTPVLEDPNPPSSTTTLRKSNDANGTHDLDGVNSSNVARFTKFLQDSVIVNRLKSKWGWVVTLATFVLFFITYGFIGCYGLLFVSLQEEFNSGATETGME